VPPSGDQMAFPSVHIGSRRFVGQRDFPQRSKRDFGRVEKEGERIEDHKKYLQCSKAETQRTNADLLNNVA
jgi:hypothetical protein